MKKLITMAVIIFTMMMLQNKIYAQSDVSGGGGAGHNGAGNSTWYVGWDANTTFPLNIRHDGSGSGAQDIDFYTNTTQKMTIKGTNSSDDGFVGINLTAPKNLLHLYSGAVQLTNSSTGTTFQPLLVARA